ncbi:MAG: Na+/H+ antiporter subunit E, partial [Acidimicrobiales bacterium]|nr:Na+/H+ antiporter subunit E [Acidimicrobiales bacterium]
MSRVLRPGSLVLALWLVVLWTLLWGGVTLANVLGGAVVVGVLLVAVPRPHADAERPVIRPFALVSLIVWFAWKLVEANVAVAIEVLRPPSRSRIRTAVVRVDLPGCPTGLVTAIANFITLTPGTLTLEVAPAVPSLYVHVLVFDTAEQVRDDVYEIERRIVAA